MKRREERKKFCKSELETNVVVAGKEKKKKKKEGLANLMQPVRPRANETLLEGSSGHSFLWGVWASLPRSGAIQPLFGPAMGNKARIRIQLGSPNNQF